jgi:hypothetical protein
MEHDRARRLLGYYRRLPELFRAVRRLEERLQEREKVT